LWCKIKGIDHDECNQRHHEHAAEPLVLGVDYPGVSVWYSSVTIYVAVKGIGDIRYMLRKLSERRNDFPGQKLADFM
jgi:hypothetical protein